MSSDFLVSPPELDAAEAAQDDLGVHGGVRCGRRRPHRGLGGRAEADSLSFHLAKCLCFVYIYCLIPGREIQKHDCQGEGRNPDKLEDFFISRNTFEIVWYVIKKMAIVFVSSFVLRTVEKFLRYVSLGSQHYCKIKVWLFQQLYRRTEQATHVIVTSF